MDFVHKNVRIQKVMIQIKLIQPHLLLIVNIIQFKIFFHE